MNYKKNDTEATTAEYLVDAGKEHFFPRRSVAVAVNLNSGEFVSARIHIPVSTSQAEQIAILLAALQAPRASVIYTDSRTSADAYERYRGAGKRKNEILKCVSSLLLPSTKIIFIPREQNRLANSLARYCQKRDFTGYGKCHYEKGKISVFEAREASFNEVIDLNAARAKHR